MYLALGLRTTRRESLVDKKNFHNHNQVQSLCNVQEHELSRHFVLWLRFDAALLVHSKELTPKVWVVATTSRTPEAKSAHPLLKVLE